MKFSSVKETQVIPRDYGVMKMLAGGVNLRTINLDLRILEIKANKSTSKHFHKKSESVFYVVKGTAKFEIENETRILDEGGVMVIEPMEIHQVYNIGSETCLIIEAMSPPFSKKDIFYIE